MLIGDPVAGEVEQDGALLHQLDALGVDHVLGGGHQRYVDADEVGVLDQFFNAGDALDLRRQTPCAFDGQYRVITDDVHAERQS